jgi:hypothetical protein
MRMYNVMLHLHAKFYLPNANDSLVIITKTRAKKILHVRHVAILYYTENSLIYLQQIW